MEPYSHFVRVYRFHPDQYRIIIDHTCYGGAKTERAAWRKAIRILCKILKEERKKHHEKLDELCKK